MMLPQFPRSLRFTLFLFLHLPCLGAKSNHMFIRSSNYYCYITTLRPIIAHGFADQEYGEVLAKLFCCWWDHRVYSGVGMLAWRIQDGFTYVSPALSGLAERLDSDRTVHRGFQCYLSNTKVSEYSDFYTGSCIPTEHVSQDN